MGSDLGHTQRILRTDVGPWGFLSSQICRQVVHDAAGPFPTILSYPNLWCFKVRGRLSGAAEEGCPYQTEGMLTWCKGRGAPRSRQQRHFHAFQRHHCCPHPPFQLVLAVLAWVIWGAFRGLVRAITMHKRNMWQGGSPTTLAFSTSRKLGRQTRAVATKSGGAPTDSICITQEPVKQILRPTLTYRWRICEGGVDEEWCLPYE